MEKITKREHDLMLAMGIMIVQALNSILETSKKEKIGEEFRAGIAMAVQIVMGVLKGASENFEGKKDGTN